MGRVVVFGSINLDLVAGVEKISSPGETVSGYSFDTFPGGKGANQALAAHLAGADVILFGKVGEDAAAQQLLDFYRSKGLKTKHILRTPTEPTGTAMIQVKRQSGENSIVVIPGANGMFSDAEIDALDLRGGDVVISQFEVPQGRIERLFRRARATGARTILNPAPAAKMLINLSELTDVLVVNETELSFYAGTIDVSETPTDQEIVSVARDLSVSDQQVILVTMGKRGALAVSGVHVIRIFGRQVNAVDTTGAGDCFVGAFGARLSQGGDLEAAMVFANIAASLSVQREGAGPSLPTAEEITAAQTV